MSEKMETDLSKDEAELYDRQIRLWGMESQKKLRAANVLIIGIRSLGSEIAKNILLAGINSLTILDDHIVTHSDITSNFFLHEKIEIGTKIAEQVLPRLAALNPLVKLTVDTNNVTSKTSDFFKQFSIVVATTIKFESIIKIDNYCREHDVKFIYTDVVGFFGFSVADLLEHEYFEDRVQFEAGKKRSRDSENTTVRIEAKMSFPALNKVLILPNTKQDISSIKKISRPNPLFVPLLAVLGFRRKHGRDPENKTKPEDIEELKKIADEIVELYQFSKINVEKVWDFLFDLMPPVAAVLGGIVGQEVIKALSHKEPPINNIFLLDPQTYSGKEMTV